jgi:molybdopterin synthase catalytic subunit
MPGAWPGRCPLFELSDKPIQTDGFRRQLVVPDAGACVTFEGWVRNHNDGRAVTRLEYEAYAPVAMAEGNRILEEARRKFAVCDARAVHRVGALAIGDLAVWVGVTAVHRDDAFLAARYIIDEIKTRLPIWKKEHYTDGDSGWVNCEVPAAKSREIPPAPVPGQTASF